MKSSIESLWATGRGGASKIVLVAGVVAALILVAGLYPHLRFSSSLGEWTYFKAAYDEDTYALAGIYGKATAFYRFLSSTLFFLLEKVGVPATGALILFDAIIPATCFLLAFGLTGRFLNRAASRCLAALLLVFAPDLFSLGVNTIWNGGFLTLAKFRSLIPYGEILVPDYTTSYPGIFRTPEPQLAYALLFVHWWSMLVVLSQQDREEKRKVYGGWLFLILSNVLLVFSYVFVSVPVFLLQGLILFVAAIRRSTKLAWGLFLTLLLPVLVLLIYFASLSPAPQVGSSLVFPSHLPVVTPGAVLAAVIGIGWLVLFRRRTNVKIELVYAALAGILPLLLLNQQIVTGVMVSTRDWERYIDYQPLVFSGIWLCREVLQPRLAPFWTKYLAPVGLVWVAWMLGPSLERTYQAWLLPNAQSVAIARALSAQPETMRQQEVVLNDVGLAPLVALRLGGANFLGAYTTLFFDPVADLGQEDLGAHLSNTRQRLDLYRYLFRKGVSADELKSALEGEALARSGYHLAFFFSFKDHWYPASDNRAVRTEELVRTVPLIVEEYRSFLQNPPSAWLKPMLYVASEKEPSNGRFLYRKIQDAIPRSGPSVLVYLQTAK